MSAPWVAADVRAVAMSRRRLGAAGIRTLAATGSLTDALTLLVESPYAHDVRLGQSLAAAQRAVAATFLWNVRVLGGWAPPDGVEMLRIAVGWFEIANVEARLRADPASGYAVAHKAEDVASEYELGGLSTGWRQIARSDSTGELLDRLALTGWGDVDGGAIRDVGSVLRARLLSRAHTGVPGAQAWVAGAVALLAAREQVVAARELPARARTVVADVLGERAAEATSLAELQERLPRTASWVLDGVRVVDDLWLAESQWWARVENDGFSLLGRSGFNAAPVIGAVAVMAADAWRVRGALEVAARGRRNGGMQEDFDALA